MPRLWHCTDTKLVGIQCFSGKLLALFQYKFIKIGQDRGVETDTVFYQKNNLYAHFTDVVFQIHLVLYQLDDGNQQVGVPQPAEDIIERTEILVGNAFGDAVAERGQNYHRDVFVLSLDGSRYVKSLIISRSRHTYNKVVWHGR